MNEEQIKKILDDSYDESKEDTYCSMVKDFFCKKMRWVMINVYVWSILFMAVCITSAILFFKTDDTQYQIMHAAIFICCSLSIGFLKVLAWVMIQRHSIKREIKRLELRIAKLNETIRNK